jgi:hypothetical protein
MGDESPDSRGALLTLHALRVLNLVFAGVGLLAAVANLVGRYSLPDSFISEYAPFVQYRLPMMAMASICLSLLLAYAGQQLRRQSHRAILLCQITFAVEILYLLMVWSSWRFPFSMLAPAVVAAGLLNLGLALQVVTAYPLIGLVLLTLADRRLKNLPAH